MRMTRSMFLLLLCGLAAVVHSSDVAEVLSNEIPEEVEDTKGTSRILEDTIKTVFEGLRQILKEGSAELGIPPLDPITKDEIKLKDLESSLVSGNLNLTDFVLKGISNFELLKGTVSFSRTNKTAGLILKVGSVQLSTGYTGKLELFQMMDVFGTGQIDIELKDFVFDAEVILDGRLLPPRINSITNVIVSMELPSATTVKITGLFDDEYMSNIISKQLYATLNSFLEYYANDAQQMVHNVLWTIAEIINDKILPFPFTQDNFSQQENREQMVLEVAGKVMEKLMEEKGRYIELFNKNFKKQN